MPKWVILRKGIAIANKGVREDKKHNYKEAVKFYDQCEGYFIYAIKHEAIGEKGKHVIRLKLKKYQDRAQFLKLRLSKEEIKRKLYETDKRKK